MKKYWPMIFTLLLPYVTLLALLAIFTGSNMGYNSILGNFFEHCFYCLSITMVLFLPLSLIFSVRLHRTSRDWKWDPVELLKANMILKFAQIPAFFLIFILGLLLLLTIFTMGFSLVLMLLDAWIVLCSGIFGLAGVIRAKEDGLVDENIAMLCGILQFIFVFDVISAVGMYLKAKKII